MLREAIIHIGTQKTGSTSTQTYMSQHRSDLLRQGACYPVSAGQQAHTLLVGTVATTHPMHESPTSLVWQGIEPAARRAKFLREFTAEMDGLPSTVDRVIFSDERFYQLLRAPQDVEGLRLFLEPWFDRFKIVVYLRRQDDFLASLYAEQIRTGQIREPDHRQKTGGQLWQYDHAALVNRWAKVFGEAAILPRIYENTPERRFDSIRDFASVCRFEMPAETAKSARSRPSMNLAGQQILTEIGRRVQSQPGHSGKQVLGRAWVNLAQAVTQALPGRGWRPTRDEAVSFVARYAAGNESIRRRWHKDKPSLFSTNFSDLPEIPELLTDAEKFEAAGIVLLQAFETWAAKKKEKNEQNVVSAITTGNREQLPGLLRRRLFHNSGDVEARVQLAAIFLEEGDLAQARGMLNAAIKLEPGAESVQSLDARLKAAEETANSAGTTIAAPAITTPTVIAPRIAAKATRRAGQRK